MLPAFAPRSVAVVAEEDVRRVSIDPVIRPEHVAQFLVARSEVVAEVVMSPSRAYEQCLQEGVRADDILRRKVPVRLGNETVIDADRGEDQPASLQRVVPET